MAAASAAFSSVDRRIRQIIAEQLGLSENELSNTSSFVDDLGADSLDIVELIMALEDEFEMEVPDEDVEGLLTVKDVIDYVRKCVQ
ncbi:MAG: acyl carrier protein [Deltaproteobacteria bacterium]|nr:MAG: acyl carrier protein [Deltaproteobacteria bacterium]